MAQVTAKVEGPMAVGWSDPKKCLLEHKDELQEPDAEPSRQQSTHSTLSEDLQVELDEVKRQLSQAQEAAVEAIGRAKTAEEKMAKEVREQEERKVSARKLLEEAQRKRRFQEAKAKAEGLEPVLKERSPTSLTLPRPAQGGKSSGKSSAQSPKGIRTVFKLKREVSRQRQDEVQAVKQAAEQRKKELEAILKQEEQERESVGVLQAKLTNAEVQLAHMAAYAERLAFEKEDLLCRLVHSGNKTPIFVKPSAIGRVQRRLRRTFGFTFVVLVCMAIIAYVKAFHLIDMSLENPVTGHPGE
ncbi:unnamed protein product [Cladocopium goreaui]|uniref:3-ketosteroid-9-alpha-monooxygenase oxygenase component-like C-terminal domain-containing protein n=1 Tax=Cladocopium goreaui TaxID=2562237 RepID=A0A9P1CQV9_9DINO|nr:unnamed protein product [Cladocopium goreaui]